MMNLNSISIVASNVTFSEPSNDKFLNGLVFTASMLLNIGVMLISLGIFTIILTHSFYKNIPNSKKNKIPFLRLLKKCKEFFFTFGFPLLIYGCSFILYFSIVYFPILKTIYWVVTYFWTMG